MFHSFPDLGLDLELYSATSLANEEDLFSNNLLGESYSSTSPAASRTTTTNQDFYIPGSNIMNTNTMYIKEGNMQIIPLSSTRTMSLCNTDVIRCAMVMTVESEKCRPSVC